MYLYLFVNFELETWLPVKAIPFSGKWYLRSCLTHLKKEKKNLTSNHRISEVSEAQQKLEKENLYS